MKLVAGTQNPAKIKLLKYILEGSKIDVEPIDQEKSLPEIAETGQTVLENARLKAKAYAKFLGQPVLSFDNGLYFEGLNSEKQPGTHTRRIPGLNRRPNDQETIEYYTKLISDISPSGKIRGFWEYGVCIAHPDGQLQEITFRSSRIFVNKPSQKIMPGYPLESLQIDSETGKYCSEMTEDELAKFYRTGSEMGRALSEFIFKLPKSFFV